MIYITIAALLLAAYAWGRYLREYDIAEQALQTMASIINYEKDKPFKIEAEDDEGRIYIVTLEKKGVESA